MKKNLVVGSDLKPNPEQLLEILEKFDNHQAVEIRKQLMRGVLTNEHVQTLIEHRNPSFEGHKTCSRDRGGFVPDVCRLDGSFGRVCHDWSCPQHAPAPQRSR